jgi:hypothetical protein
MKPSCIYSFRQDLWNLLHMQWEEEYDIYEMISYFREAREQSCFMKALIIGCWSIWNHRNNAIFEDQAVNLSTCFRAFF